MLLFESYGQFNNAKEICQYIIDNINTSIINKEQIIDISQFNTFVKKVSIIYNDTTYIDNQYNYVNRQLIRIKANYPSNYTNKIYKRIIQYMIHEFTHGYEDWNRLRNKEKPLIKLMTLEYNNAIKQIKYGKTKDLKLLAETIYLLNDQEQNAYLSQLNIDLENIVNELNINITNYKYKTKMIIDKLFNSDNIWHDYKNIGIFLDTINNLSDDDERKQELINLYNSEILKNFGDYNSYIQKFNNRIKQLLVKHKRFMKKITQLISKNLVTIIQ